MASHEAGLDLPITRESQLDFFVTEKRIDTH
jgi:hypothetical protein